MVQPLREDSWAASTNGLVTSRAQSMNSSATGLIIRRFKVMIPTGLGRAGSLTGKTLTAKFLAPNRSMDAGQSASKRPSASMALFNGRELETTSARGTGRPHAANVSAMTVLATLL